jgi:hypothetical protein
MTPPALTKAQRREIRRLCAVAHERELSQVTAQLAADCDRWRQNEIDVFELVERIHKFHDGAQRDLYKTYVMGEPLWGGARGFTLGLITEAEIPVDLLPRIVALRDLFNQTP